MSESDTMFNERDRRCAAVQLMHSTDPSYDNRSIASTLKMQIWIATNNRTCPGWWKQSFRQWLWSLVWFQVRAWKSAWFRSRLGSQHQSVPRCAEKCGDILVQSCGRWQTLGVAAGLGASPQVQRDPGLASERVLRLCTFLSLAPLLPDPNSLNSFVWSEYHQHDLPQLQSQADRRHLPSIRRATAGACGKGMITVLDLYRGGDWGWRRLHWIDVSSTT